MGESKVSATQITRVINAVCEDCGCKWTATLAEVPVTVFIKDLEEYYKKLSNNLLEEVEPPMVLCVFRPSDRDILDTEVTLSCVAPRQDSPYHWRINHNGPAEGSGCQIIPLRGKNLESKSKYICSEQDIVTTIKEEVAIKEEVTIKDEFIDDGGEEMITGLSFSPSADDKDVKPELTSIIVSVLDTPAADASLTSPEEVNVTTNTQQSIQHQRTGKGFTDTGLKRRKLQPGTILTKEVMSLDALVVEQQELEKRLQQEEKDRLLALALQESLDKQEEKDRLMALALQEKLDKQMKRVDRSRGSEDEYILRDRKSTGHSTTVSSLSKALTSPAADATLITPDVVNITPHQSIRHHRTGKGFTDMGLRGRKMQPVTTVNNEALISPAADASLTTPEVVNITPRQSIQHQRTGKGFTDMGLKRGRKMKPATTVNNEALTSPAADASLTTPEVVNITLQQSIQHQQTGKGFTDMGLKRRRKMQPATTVNNEEMLALKNKNKKADSDCNYSGVMTRKQNTHNKSKAPLVSDSETTDSDSDWDTPSKRNRKKKKPRKRPIRQHPGPSSCNAELEYEPPIECTKFLPFTIMTANSDMNYQDPVDMVSLNKFTIKDACTFLRNREHDMRKATDDFILQFGLNRTTNNSVYNHFMKISYLAILSAKQTKYEPSVLHQIFYKNEKDNR